MVGGRVAAPVFGKLTDLDGNVPEKLSMKTEPRKRHLSSKKMAVNMQVLLPKNGEGRIRVCVRTTFFMLFFFQLFPKRRERMWLRGEKNQSTGVFFSE